MSKRTMLVSLIGVAVLGMISLAAWAQNKPQESLSIDKVPAPVKAAILKETAGGEIKEIEAETRNGKTIYEVEFVRAGKTMDIMFAADGAVLGTESDDEQKAETEEQEREVKEAEVPAAALATLRKLAGDAKFTEFAEEIEHGGKFYEGSWKTVSGSNMDVLVTAAGDLVEIEEQVTANQVPAAVIAAAKKLAGAESELRCEKKTMILYEIKFGKDGQRHEVLFTPDGRTLEKNVEKAGEDKEE